MKAPALLNVLSSRVPAVFAGITLILTPPLLAGTPEFKPETKVQQLAYLIEIKRQIPELFKDAAKYDIELFTLLENQAELLHQLKQNPEYETLLSQKKYVDITVTPPPEGISVGYTEIKSEAVRAWKAGLTQTAKELEFDGITTPERLKSIIGEIQRTLRPIADPQKLLSKTGYIEKTGATEKDHQAFRDRVKALKPKNDVFHHECEHGQSTLLGKLECVYSHYEELEGLPYLPSRAQLTEAIDQIRAEQKLYALAEFSALAQDKAWKDFTTTNIDPLKADDLVFLDDRNDALKPLLAKSLEGLPETQLEIILNGVHSNIRSYASQATTHPHQEKAPVQIVEVPPEIGIFRGFTGGDCSSQFSFPYPNDPHERVFFIHEGSDTPRGYVSATEVTLANGENALYVITISGCHVSPGNTDLILRGLEQAKAELGVKHILLPQSENMAALINFPGIRGVYGKYIRKGKPEAIHYQDPSIRQQIENFRPSSNYNQSHYDEMHGNQMAVRFRADHQSLGIKTQVSPKKISGIQPKAFDKISTQEILDFILDLHYSNRTQTKEDVLSIPEVKTKIKISELESTLDLLSSCQDSGQNLKIQEFKTQLEKKLYSAGFEPGFLTANSHYLYPGLLACVDAFSDENKEETAQAILKSYREHDRSPVGIDFSTLSPEKKAALESTPTFQTFYKKLISDLKNSDPKTRKHAAQTSELFLASPVQVHLTLIEALKDIHKGVASASRDALAKIKPNSEAALQALVQLLPQEHLYKHHVSTILGEIKPVDPKVHWALVDALKGKESDSKLSAIRALREIQPTDPKIFDELARLLEDENEDVRNATIRALGKLLPQDSKINLTLSSLLKTKLSALNRQTTLEALEHIRPTDQGILISLIEIFKNPKEPENIRDAAQKALSASQSEDKKIQQILADLVGIESDILLSSNAGNILGNFKKLDPEVLNSMIKGLENPSVDVRNRTVVALRSLADRVEVQLALVKMLSDPNEAVAFNARQAFDNKLIADRRVYVALLRALQGISPGGREEAAGVLGGGQKILLNPTDEVYLKIQQTLRTLLNDPYAAVRGQATRAFNMMKIKIEDSETYLTLVNLLKDRDPTAQTWANLTLSDSTPADPRVFQSLMDILKHTDKKVRNSAAGVLTRIAQKTWTPPYTQSYLTILNCMIKSGQPISDANQAELLALLKLMESVNK